MGKFLLGCDPGAIGGLAWFEEGKGALTHPMPKTDEGLLFLLRGIVKPEREVHAVIELVGGYVKPPRAQLSVGENGETEAKVEGGQPGSAMFKFGENAGLLRGMLLGLGASVEMVYSRTWQKAFGLSRRREQSKPEWKRELKNAAQRRFPGTRVTLLTCDALLLLEFARMKYSAEGLPKILQRTPQDAADPEVYIHTWKETPFVFRGNTIIRRASEADLQSIPRRAFIAADPKRITP